MKNLFKILTIFLIFSLISGCKQEINTSVSVEDIINKMIELENFNDFSLEDLTTQEIAEKYGVTKEYIEEGLVFYPENEERADKIILIKVKDKNNVEDIERAVSSEIIGITNSWKNNEQEAKKVEDHIFKTKDVYVLLYVGENPKQIEEIFDTSLSTK